MFHFATTCETVTETASATDWENVSVKLTAHCPGAIPVIVYDVPLADCATLAIPAHADAFTLNVPL
jgi:hypothetical protein